MVSKLCYCIFAACLNQSERKRLDGFQARCLRKIYRISPSYYSRVSNSAVLSITGERPLSEAIAKDQMVFLGKLARRPGNDPVRSSVFQPGGIELRMPTGTRKRGRPRQMWGNMVLNNCMKVAGSRARLADFFRPEAGAAAAWEAAVRSWHD